MPIFVIIPLFAIVALLIAFLLFGGIASQNKHARLLADLGMQNRWWGGKTSSFYKWSWRKTSKERVWGEYIVKEAFKKARVWLTLDDLAFFEQKCVEFQHNRKINNQPIIDRVEKIIHRTEELENNIRQQVREMSQQIISISEGEAKRFLQDSGIHVEEKDRILPRYGCILIRKHANQVGYAMLGHHTGGDENKGLSQIQGIEGWERWLAIYKQLLNDELSRNITPSNQMILEGVISSIRAGLLKDYEQDIHSHRTFMEAMDKQLDNKHFPVTPGQIEALECYLYTWQFDNEARFNHTDHNRVRQFVSRSDLSPRFRRYVLLGIHSNLESIHSLTHSMPNRVVFFGKNGFARAYAADQYHLHLEKYLEVFAKLGQQESGAPDILTLTETEIDARRKEIAAGGRGAVLKGHALNVIDTSRKSIEEILQRKKERSIDHRKIDEEIAEKRGWLIDFPWDEENVEVFGVFRNELFNTYLPVNCDNFGSIDFLSNTSSAKRQRTVFFEAVLDLLLKPMAMQAFVENP